jgi:DNA-binding NarL/FixJ family response regulator
MTADEPAIPRARRVVVVDNDPVMRAGTYAVLAGSRQLQLVAAVDHDTALSWSAEWDGVDVAVVDASDQRREVDQFPGVDVVRSIRNASTHLLVIVLTGQYLHPGLRRRMWEAGADFFYPRDEGMTEEELVSAVVCPEQHRRLTAPQIRMHDELGVTDRTRVNELVERLSAPEIRSALSFERRKKADPHGERSRWWQKVRRTATGPTGLTPVKASGEIAHDLDSPSVVQLRKFLAAMTRVQRGQQE